ncbi:methyltransferase domain-containing protein [Thiorhodococcus mannitoliphagus]|uniref:Methyltransferase domain-containing protein n=1 Tax=Thiorhodococcus mannitoliphagus TaxID=329406 RepID=A0A6P1E0P3_9GAMM|nr:methyltransferase domain-containing protein [Thiorhodococcus mannitoliphagus]NEX22803.1 methyltransferase domain-containing protein [Thiorhodococcus mannitoliphagus]
MSTSYSQVVETARTYYNSEDADNFYFHVWGGEDIHIGLYDRPGEPIAEASRKTVERMAACVKGLGPESRVLDLGSGYGGAARYLAKTYGCKVTALNLSERENARNREMSREQGLGGLIEVIEGSFESVPAPEAAYDLVWSQDAILHSGEREQVISEAARVLRPGGELVFTDPMQADDCPEGVLQPVYDRIHLSSLGSIGFYREVTARLGLREVEIVEMTENLSVHYQRVHEELERVRPELKGLVSDAYIERMLTGLSNWVEAGKKGYLSWGILHFQKPTS